MTNTITNLDDKVNKTLVVITGDRGVRADHQTAVNASRKVDVLTLRHKKRDQAS